ncbi:hypothetical protein A2U01_0109484, partial [Trifolium medium]|nr:hypothetical protein [Trifolium medium]
QAAPSAGHAALCAGLKCNNTNPANALRPVP